MAARVFGAIAALLAAHLVMTYVPAVTWAHFAVFAVVLVITAMATWLLGESTIPFAVGFILATFVCWFAMASMLHPGFWSGLPDLVPTSVEIIPMSMLAGAIIGWLVGHPWGQRRSVTG